jgi:rhodanese-related sulfurtransferase
MGIALVCIGVYHSFFWFLKKTAFFKSIIQDKFLYKAGVSGIQAAGVLSIVFFVSGTYHFLMPGGLLSLEGEVVEGMQNAYAGSFIPKISEKKVHKLLDSDTVFIDARLARDFKAGHLKGAISVPVDANDVERQKVTADIAKDARIVMYCQSSACKYAEIVAIKLIDKGYSNISIFKGGWAEWVAKNGKPRETAI